MFNPRTARALATTAAMIAAAALAGTPALGAAADGHDTTTGGLQSSLDGVVRHGAVGALVEVRSDSGSRRASAGVAEIGSTRPVLEHGRFRIGSITKSFTATVVLQLVDEGLIQLDDPLALWFPAIPRAQDITVRHLLGHTSGIFDSFRTMPRPPSPAFLEATRRTWTPQELIDRALAPPPVFDRPGSEFSYSNTNYTILGAIVERVTGASYGEAIEQRILRPLKLSDTSLPGTRTRIKGPHPHGYVPLLREGRVELAGFTEMNPSIMGAAGEMISTTEDLNDFFDALLSGELVSPELVALMKTPSTPGGRYGLGLWIVRTSCGDLAYGHDGDAIAFQSYSFTSGEADRQVTVALTPDFSGDPDDAVDALIDDALCG